MTQEAVKIERASVPALDRILGVPFKILDDGIVRVVDYMGADESIVHRNYSKDHDRRGLAI